ncbi:hypothetical protein [Pseudobacteriovorax antillogorgiicola]|uniref:Lipoprotein n=1 Tax=Pseudobacteriovorax antillogorgiicola TaxID=1513793 RepID=A0A1Y6B3N9_9BACT|nr:hypothetical protein [Pseudobacteriovorax antillogorgiicola]TCS59430.1 hypothetical protein EDD56_101341 [Pseudobacteriovorax antillogorgiicola]SME88345.1 hypothetical protein SAMN06296036_101144 [Pseudobacteriovorax antillogorgiicola]
MKSYLMLGGAIVLGLGLSSCGKWAKAKNQSVDTIAVPEYPSFRDNVYSLTPSQEAVGYGGTMVILNQAVDPGDLADLLQASIDSRKAWAETRLFTEENDFALKYAEGGIYEVAIEDMKLELKKFEAEARDRTEEEVPDETLEITADTWLNEELERLYPGDTKQQSDAMAVIGRYCDAKIWELATNSYFAMNRYSERPTPMAFCEPFFESQGYFQGATCADNPAGRNYFGCMWSQGVLNTSFFKAYDQGTQTKITAMVNDPTSLGLMRDVLGLEDSAFTFPSPLYKRRTIGENKENRDYFSNIILKQDSVGRLCTASISGISELCSVFSYSYNAASLDALEMTPFDFMAMVEGRNIDLSTLFPLPNRPDSVISTKDIFHYFGFRQGHNNNESDRLFHKLVDGEPTKKPVFEDPTFAEKGSEIESIFDSQLYPKLNPQDLAVFNRKSQQISDLEKDYKAKNQQYEDYRQQITDTSAKAFEVGYRPNVAHAFMEIRLKVSNRNGVLRAYHWIKDFEDVAIIACLDLSTRKRITEGCTADPLDKVDASQYLAAKHFHVDQETGKVEFEVLFNDPAIIGFELKERVTEEGAILDSFSDLTANDYQDRSLFFELYPNLVYGYLEILTGKAFLRENGQDIEEAAVSLWDQNL